MNEIVNKFLLAGDKVMPEMYLRQLRFTNSVNLLKTKKEYKNLKKQEIQDIFTKTNYTNPASNTIRLMAVLKIDQEEQLLIKY